MDAAGIARQRIRLAASRRSRSRGARKLVAGREPMRRVVVTGMGMVTPLACGVEATWRRLIAGESGARKVEAFDVSDLPARIAGIIPRRDGTGATYHPSYWMEPNAHPNVHHFIPHPI